jgi:homoserine O-acetyltransferase
MAYGTAVLSNFTFDSGETLQELNIHYQTLGKLKVHADGTNNAVLVLHGTTESSNQFLNPTSQACSSIPDASFPRYQYSDMIRAHRRLLTQHLGINHTRLILGVSMGGMYVCMMGESYPDFADALMPIASLPVQVAGHNRLWRKFVIEIVRSDPSWYEGNYVAQPLVGLASALSLVQTMFAGLVSFSSKYTTRDATDKFADALLLRVPAYDANDFLYAWNSSHLYDPEPGLGLISAPLTAVNTADDLMNPAELRILERTVEHQMRRGFG